MFLMVFKKSGGSIGGWMGVKAILRIAYSNKKIVRQTFIKTAKKIENNLENYTLYV